MHVKWAFCHNGHTKILNGGLWTVSMEDIQEYANTLALGDAYCCIAKGGFQISL
jgi:hypothetical protein